MLLGAADSLVAWNTVRGNTGTEINSGGIVLMSAADLTEGADPTGNTVKNNTVVPELPGGYLVRRHGQRQRPHAATTASTSSPSGSCV